jgi:hypothetical protein
MELVGAGAERMTVGEEHINQDATSSGPLAGANLWFGRLFDDAALFPPRRAHPTDAVVQHRSWRASGYAEMVGPLVCPDSQWPSVSQQFENSDDFSVALTVPSGVPGVEAAIRAVTLDGVRLAQVEVPVDATDDLPPLVDALSEVTAAGTNAFVELPIAALTGRLCDEIAAVGLGLKVRTGGVAADAFPSEIDLASVIATCVEAGLSFKLTAGLHHAVRHRALTTGFEHHGFLNVLLAASAAIRGSDRSCVATMLGLEHPGVVVASLRSLEPELARTVRELFVSFGTCNIEEPIEDLVGLGLVAEAPDVS